MNKSQATITKRNMEVMASVCHVRQTLQLSCHNCKYHPDDCINFTALYNVKPYERFGEVTSPGKKVGRPGKNKQEETS